MDKRFAKESDSAVLQGVMLDMRKAFVCALLLGVVGIIVPQLLNYPLFAVVVPLSCMAIYVWVGAIYSTDTPIREQFADSVYYLGFLYTLIALVVSLYFYRSATLNSALLVNNFSLALITTIAGLAVRIYITNYQVEMEDVERQMLQGLDHAASEFVRKSKLITMQLEFSHDETQDAINKAISNAVDRLEEAGARMERHADMSAKMFIENAEKSNRALAHVIRKFKQDLDEVQLPADIFAEALTPPLQRLSERLDESQTLLRDLGGEQENMLSHTRQLVGGISDTARGMDKIGLSLDLFNAKLEANSQANTELARVVANITAVSETTEKIADNLARQGNASLQTIKQLETLITGIDNLPAHIEALTGHLQHANADVAEVFLAMGRQSTTGQRISGELEAIASALSKSRTTIKAISDLGLHATAAYKRLEAFNSALESHSGNMHAMSSLAQQEITLANQHRKELARILAESRQALQASSAEKMAGNGD